MKGLLSSNHPDSAPQVGFLLPVNAVISIHKETVMSNHKKITVTLPQYLVDRLDRETRGIYGAQKLVIVQALEARYGIKVEEPTNGHPR